jgi:hypothetical protein
MMTAWRQLCRLFLLLLTLRRMYRLCTLVTVMVMLVVSSYVLVFMRV